MFFFSSSSSTNISQLCKVAATDTNSFHFFRSCTSFIIAPTMLKSALMLSLSLLSHTLSKLTKSSSNLKEMDEAVVEGWEARENGMWKQERTSKQTVINETSRRSHQVSVIYIPWQYDQLWIYGLSSHVSWLVHKLSCACTACPYYCSH